MFKDKIKEILKELTKKRGRHSELWLYPEKESLETATNDILALIGEWGKEMVGKDQWHGDGKGSYFGDLKTRLEIRTRMAKSLGQKKEGE